MNKEQLELLPESDRKGRGFRYSHAYAQEAAGPPPAYHSTQIIHSSQPPCSRVVVAAFITLLCCVCVWPASPFAIIALAYAFKADTERENNCQEERAKVAINRSVTCATMAFIIGAVVLATTTAFSCYLHYYH